MGKNKNKGKRSLSSGEQSLGSGAVDEIEIICKPIVNCCSSCNCAKDASVILVPNLQLILASSKCGEMWKCAVSKTEDSEESKAVLKCEKAVKALHMCYFDDAKVVKFACA